MMTQKSIASLIASLALLAIPLAISAESTAARVWNSRLVAPDYQAEPNRHTPQHIEGTYLPPEITTSTAYTVADSPLILTTTTRIPSGVTVTIEAGVTVAAHEFAELHIDGTLQSRGTNQNPILFTTNEIHPKNKQWNGVIVGPAGTANLTYTTIEYASPALSCLANSHVTANHLQTRYGLVGVYTESPTCVITNSRLQAEQHGIITRNAQPQVDDVNISAGKQDIAVF